MPRPFRTPGALAWLAAAVCCALLGPAGLHAALAAAAGTLFEAAPFVLVGEALPAGRWRALSASFGCGCGARVPGALSLAAAALCWFAFGPLVTFARTLAACLFLRCRKRRPPERAAHADAFTDLLSLGPCAAAAALGSSALAGMPSDFAHSVPGTAAALSAGLVLGAAAPCATAAVAIAAALAPHVPFAAAGILSTAGFVPATVFRSLWRRPQTRRAPVEAGEAREAHSGAAAPPQHRDRHARWARGGLLLALALFAARRQPGFVNPRLTPFVWLGTIVAATGLLRPASSRAAIAVPAVMLLALAGGSPQPNFEAEATRLDDAFAGERLAFTGVAHRRGAATVLERFAITCCRADAAPVAVRTAARLPVPDGAWVTARGVLEASSLGLVLRPAAWRAIPRPADPFIYR